MMMIIIVNCQDLQLVIIENINTAKEIFTNINSINTKVKEKCMKVRTAGALHCCRRGGTGPHYCKLLPPRFTSDLLDAEMWWQGGDFNRKNENSPGLSTWMDQPQAYQRQRCLQQKTAKMPVRLSGYKPELGAEFAFAEIKMSGKVNQIWHNLFL